MKIMVCYDDSAVSKNVVREAQKHAAQWDAEIRLFQWSRVLSRSNMQNL